MHLTCCNTNVTCGDVWFLKDIKGFTARKIFIGNCPVCNNDVAVLFETRTEDNKMFVNELTGIEAVKTIFREKQRKVAVLPNIQSECLHGWIYGVNTQVKNKSGKVIKIRQYASDFKGNKTLRKEVTV